MSSIDSKTGSYNLTINLSMMGNDYLNLCRRVVILKKTVKLLQRVVKINEKTYTSFVQSNLAITRAHSDYMRTLIQKNDRVGFCAEIDNYVAILPTFEMLENAIIISNKNLRIAKERLAEAVKDL